MTRLGDALIRAYSRRDPAAEAAGTAAVDIVAAAPVSTSVPRCVESRITDDSPSPSLSLSAVSRAPLATWNWPTITNDVLAVARTGFERLAERLRRGSLERGVCSVAFSGTGRDVGRTTVILSLARVLKEQYPQESLLLIDADFSRPGLTSQVGLVPARGAWEVLQSDLPLESALHPGSDAAGSGRLALLPLSGPVTNPELETVGTDGLLPLLAELREQFPLILIDAGAWNPLKPPLWKCAGIDGLIHVQRHDAPTPGILHCERLLCREMGLEFLGVVETFAPSLTDSAVHELHPTQNAGPTGTAGGPHVHLAEVPRYVRTRKSLR